MPKAKSAGRRKKFDYNQDRKKLKKQHFKKQAPRIENPHIRNAWDNKKSMAKNLQDMGLSFDPNRALPIKKQKVLALEKGKESTIVRKPYILDQLEEEASRPEKDTKTLSTDIIMYVQHMIREHCDNYKAMARDEKNYYQDTPKQIKRKVDEYKRCHPDHYAAFMTTLAGQTVEMQDVTV